MQNIIAKHKNKLAILLIICAPIIMAICNVLMLSIFNLGTYFGSFWRHLFEIVVS